jgi:hypothetical protein
MSNAEMIVQEKVFENFNLGQALVKSLEQAAEYERGDKTKTRVLVRGIPILRFGW